LLQLFPGRTLEELDHIDLNRLHRALAARRMEAVEMRRRRFLEGKIKAKDLEQDEWALILQMDEWARSD
jgi:hypothetical protein